MQFFQSLISQRQDGAEAAADQLNQEENELEGETAGGRIDTLIGLAKGTHW